ncbi:MAG: hypothetical protein QY307_04120 [Acidimicrobiia bacterium]|nr:MAG: hypothetical protein QY307_04120 [Acidimicrobiia bacterium]
MHRALSLSAGLALLLAACSGSAASTPATTDPPGTTVPTTSTSTTVPDAAATTTSEAPATTTTSTTVASTTTSSTIPLPVDPDLEPWAGLFRQPTTFTGYLLFEPNGVVRAGEAVDNLPVIGRWDYDEAADAIVFSDFDFGDGCGGEQGRYARDSAPGGSRRLTLIEDPCTARVEWLIQAESSCQCLIYLRVDLPEDAEETEATEEQA